MVPSAYVILDQLPRIANGKLDRKALPKPEDKYDTSNYVAPRTPVENIVAGIWREVLGRERVGSHDNFFELGGHSLLATQVIARIIAAFGIELPLRVMFEAPTVAGLAMHIEKATLAMEDMLSRLEALSDEEAKSMLSLETNESSGTRPNTYRASSGMSQ
jgi:acyl carrier protein